MFLVGPVLLGGLISFIAAARPGLLGIAAVTFAALGVVVPWIVGAEIADMYAVAGLWHIARRKPWVTR